LPRWFAAVHPRFKVPHHAELVIGAIVAVTAATIDLRSAIGFSSFAVLLYYALTNVAAFTLPSEQRRWPRPLSVLGLAGCLVLAFTLPIESVVAGAGVFAIGAAVYAARHSQRPGVATRNE
jgi:basic amino acid/polyamine antiporter, APA family